MWTWQPRCAPPPPPSLPRAGAAKQWPSSPPRPTHPFTRSWIAFCRKGSSQKAQWTAFANPMQPPLPGAPSSRMHGSRPGLPLCPLHAAAGYCVAILGGTALLQVTRGNAQARASAASTAVAQVGAAVRSLLAAASSRAEAGCSLCRLSPPHTSPHRPAPPCRVRPCSAGLRLPVHRAPGCASLLVHAGSGTGSASASASAVATAKACPAAPCSALAPGGRLTSRRLLCAGHGHEHRDGDSQGVEQQCGAPVSACMLVQAPARTAEGRARRRMLKPWRPQAACRPPSRPRLPASRRLSPAQVLLPSGAPSHALRSCQLPGRRRVPSVRPLTGYHACRRHGFELQLGGGHRSGQGGVFGHCKRPGRRGQEMIGQCPCTCVTMCVSLRRACRLTNNTWALPEHAWHSCRSECITDWTIHSWVEPHRRRAPHLCCVLKRCWVTLIHPPSEVRTASTCTSAVGRPLDCKIPLPPESASPLPGRLECVRLGAR